MLQAFHNDTPIEGARTLNEIKQVVAANSAVTFAAATIIGLMPTDGNVASVYANGKIFAIPYNKTALSIIEVDCTTKEITTFASFASLGAILKWTCAVLANDGMIYCFPQNAIGILKLNPKTRETTIISSTAAGYNGAALAPNGKIYCTPSITTSILEFDPVTQTSTFYGNLGTGNPKWNGAALALDGKIYFPPKYNSNILEFDPISKTIILYPVAGWVSVYSTGFVMAANGKLYTVPDTGTTILEFDPITKAIVLFGNLVGTTKWNFGCLAPNGKIYCSPARSSNILEIDPINKTTALLGSFGATSTIKYSGIHLGDNNCLYMFSRNDVSNIWEISFTQTVMNFSKKTVRGPYLNKQ